MTDYMTLCILGRQPQIGLAELESLFGATALKPLTQGALLKVPAQDINFKNLGGTIKTAKLLSILPFTDWQKITRYLLQNVPKHLLHLPEGKFTLGISTYDLDVNTSGVNRTALQIKKIIRNTGRPVRVVPNKENHLNAAQVLHNKLTHKGAWELLLIKDGDRTILAQTLFVQDIEDYAARDQARPKRDARVGMLPPKLAQILINLALGSTGTKGGRLKKPKVVRLLDPFCGTGVILQEALLMGYDVLGADIDQRMTDYAKENMQWLVKKYPSINSLASIETTDATNAKWPAFTAVASETYLGSPLNSLPAPDKLRQITLNADTIISKFLINLAGQLKPGQRLCLAVPAWRTRNGQFIYLPLIAKLTDMGYTRLGFKHVSNPGLIYYRENQTVARQLLVLERSK